MVKRRDTVLKVAALVLLAGAAGCSDDVARLGGGLTTASLGIEPSNQDRIIRKVGTEGTRIGVRPSSAPEQDFPDETEISEPEEVTFEAPLVASDALPPLKPSAPASSEIAAQAAPIEEATPPATKAAPLRQVRRSITKPKIAAEGIPVVPPAPREPGRLRRIGEPLHTGSVSRTAAAKEGSYTVKSGDTLYAIARANGVSVSALMGANGLSDSALKLGQQLIMPGSPGHSPVAKVVAPVKVALASEAPRLPVRSATAAVRTVVAGSVPDEEPAKAVSKPKVEAVASTSGKFAWPARGRILKGFGQRTANGKSDGIDIAIPEGSAVRAVADGIVLYSGSELKDFGNLVLVRHNDGWVSAYANGSENLVKRGDRVTSGQTIAKSGKSGNAAQPQLHFELRRNSKPVDPERHLKG